MQKNLSQLSMKEEKKQVQQTESSSMDLQDGGKASTQLFSC